MNFLPVSLSSYSLATVIFHILVPRSSPRWRLIGLEKEERGNLYLLPSYNLRLLALPNRSRTATQKPTPVYAISASGDISPEISCRMQENYISTGIYRCSILDFDLKFCENSRLSRLSADKRFLMYFHYIPLRSTPMRGVDSAEPHPTGVVCETVCNRKCINIF